MASLTSPLSLAQATLDTAIAARQGAEQVLTALDAAILQFYLNLGKTQAEKEAFVLSIEQNPNPANVQLTIPIEQQYRDAYVVLEDAKTEQEQAQTEVDNLNNASNATIASVSNDIGTLFQLMNAKLDAKFGEMETRFNALDEKLAAVDARVANVEIKANSAKGVTVAEVKAACKAGVEELPFCPPKDPTYNTITGTVGGQNASGCQELLSAAYYHPVLTTINGSGNKFLVTYRNR